MVDDLELASVAGFEGSKGVRDPGDSVVDAVAAIEGDTREWVSIPMER